MTVIGWIFMIVSIGVVTALISFCYWRVLTKPSATKHMQAPLDIDTGDRDE